MRTPTTIFPNDMPRLSASHTLHDAATALNGITKSANADAGYFVHCGTPGEWSRGEWFVKLQNGGIHTNIIHARSVKSLLQQLLAVNGTFNHMRCVRDNEEA
jgi:hypothetical protein